MFRKIAVGFGRLDGRPLFSSSRMMPKLLMGLVGVVSEWISNGGPPTTMATEKRGRRHHGEVRLSSGLLFAGYDLSQVIQQRSPGNYATKVNRQSTKTAMRMETT